MTKNYLPLALSFLLAAATGCADYIDAPQASGETGKLITLTAGIPDDESTRIAYDDGTRKLTWEKGDKIGLLAYNDDTISEDYKIFTLEGEGGGTTGRFTGEAFPGEEISGPIKYLISYPAEESGKQTQTGNGSVAHLKEHIRLRIEDITDLSQPFIFKMFSSIMKFDLSNIPTAEIGQLQSLRMEVETQYGEKSETLYFSQTTPGAGGTLTAYMSFGPNHVHGVKPGGKFTVYLSGTGGTWKAEATSAAGKEYQAGQRYTAALGSWSDVTANRMKFTVRTANANEEYTLRFDSSRTPAQLTIDWGDGSNTTTVAPGTTANPTHTYAAAGDYTITVTSAQTDPAQQQLPNGFTFGKDKRLISINTPLLNTGRTSMSTFFFQCTNLSSVAADLFTYNTEATGFGNCFSGCTALTAIPAGLFDKNTEATDFNYCFYGCTALTAIPAGLFDKNTRATSFNSCFSGCNALTAIPSGLFDKNTEATEFSYCFSRCTHLKLNESIFCNNPATCKATRFAGKNMNFKECFFQAGSYLDSSAAGTAPDLWNYAKGSGTWQTGSCFQYAKISNAADVPAGWK